jgi:hypothetical protein
VVATEETIGPDNPGTATAIELLVDPNDDLDETFDSTVPIVRPISLSSCAIFLRIRPWLST